MYVLAISTLTLTMGKDRQHKDLLNSQTLVLDCSQLQMVCPVPFHKAPGLPLLSIPNKPPNISHQKTHAYGISTVQREQYRRANSYLWCTSAADHCLRCEVPGSNKLGVSEVVCDLVTRGRIKCI